MINIILIQSNFLSAPSAILQELEIERIIPRIKIIANNNFSHSFCHPSVTLCFIMYSNWIIMRKISHHSTQNRSMQKRKRESRHRQLNYQNYRRGEWGAFKCKKHWLCKFNDITQKEILLRRSDYLSSENGISSYDAFEANAWSIFTIFLSERIF